MAPKTGHKCPVLEETGAVLSPCWMLDPDQSTRIRTTGKRKEKNGDPVLNSVSELCDPGWVP